MALNTKMPSDIPTTDALASIPADLLGPIPAELRLGQNVLMVQEKPAELGDTVTIVARLRITREGKEKASGDAEGEIRHFRAGKIIAAWLKGEPEPPNPEDEQPALFGDDGQPTEEPEDEPAEEPEVADNVARPDFSNAGE